VTLLLGPLEVRDGTAPVKLAGRKARALLARLALDANRTVSAERLVTDLWGEDPPQTAAKMVQIHVSQLRKVLPPGVLVTRPGGYALAVEPESLDLARFERLRDAGRAALAAGDAGSAGRHLADALALWRGEALAEFGEPFAVLEAARLAQLRLDCVEDRIDADLALGRHTAVTAELEALVAREPLRERARAQLMLALYRGGRHADALATLQDLRRILDEELGLVPSATLGALEQRILRHDASLLLENAAPERGSAVEPPPQPVARDQSGAAAVPVVAEKRERRRVTVIALGFADGDVLAGAMDDEEHDELVRRARCRMAEIVERLGGDIGPASGDQMLAAFGIRRAREDDAARAVRAALELRDAIPEVAGASPCGAVPVRVAVETGMAVMVGDVHIDGMGCSVGVAAARLGAQAPAGAVLLGPVAARAVRDVMVLEPADGGAMAVRGELAAGAARKARSPFVGREAELALLTERHRRAASGRGQVVLVTGEPGIGKSRLVDEVIARLPTPEAGDTTTFRCRPDSKSSLHPVAAVLQESPERWRAAGRAIGLCAADAALLETQLAAAGDAVPEPAVEPGDEHGRLLCTIADVLLAPTDSAPSVLVFEDVHWADAATLELIERLVRQLATEPVLVLLTMRADVVPAWTSLSYATVVALDRLGAPELELLVRGLLHDSPPPEGLVAAIDERSDGVPLFAEELVLALRDAGTLRRGGEGWELADLPGPLAVPDTLHDLLLARLGQLGPARVVAQVGAVLGRRFNRELLDAVGGLDEGVVDEALARLVDAEVLHERGRGASARYVFKHALVRDAAYASLQRSARQELHARAARALEERHADVGAAEPEVLARHVDPAGEHALTASW
jgi:DNA-binding SARP family transcriptional activator